MLQREEDASLVSLPTSSSIKSASHKQKHTQYAFKLRLTIRSHKYMRNLVRHDLNHYKTFGSTFYEAYIHYKALQYAYSISPYW